MEAHKIEHKHALSGDWTIAGVINQVDALSDSLKGFVGVQDKQLHVDCAEIHTIDMSGLQLLHVWMQCAKMRGIRTRLINLPETMQQIIQRLGLDQAFTDNYQDA
jgi:anti-anti-sigma regulatory factor